MVDEGTSAEERGKGAAFACYTNHPNLMETRMTGTYHLSQLVLAAIARGRNLGKRSMMRVRRGREWELDWRKPPRTGAPP